MNRPAIVVPLALQHTNQATCSTPWYLINSEYLPAAATWTPLINGEEAFRAVHRAIAQATKTIDIICWGFQPSMYFIRDGQAPCIGELLLAKAEEGVEVRILGWEAPFNTAGVAGEANLPGKGTLSWDDRAGQTSTDEQYAYDRLWFAQCGIHDNMASAIRKIRRIPVFVGRGFSLFERAEIAYQATYGSLDLQLSASTRAAMTGAPSHHQKTVLVDFELTDRAVGFVMGHNMLDEYWDTNQHSSSHRFNTKPAPNAGARGNTPRQDISAEVTGPIVACLHDNFAKAWLKETGEDLNILRKTQVIGPQLQCRPDATLQLAQILRTQPQERVFEIQQMYLQTVNNATQFIYIENQYFRWPPLAELIKNIAASQARAGRDPAEHGALHLFVITNDTDDGVGAGTANTQRMLESLGRGDTIPELTKLKRIEQAQARYDAKQRSIGELLEQQALLRLTQVTDALGPSNNNSKASASVWETRQNRHRELEALKQEIEAIENNTVTPNLDIPNLKVHICSLVAPDSSPGHWMPVYVHSKLMIVNDVFTTHGSANINTRSMQVDSELNIAHEWMSETQALRRRLWDLHTGGKGAQDDPKMAFEAWRDLINENKDLKRDRREPAASLVEFYYGKATVKDLD